MGNLSKIVLDDETLEVEDTKARTDIGDVTYLKTEQKGSIVDAVNECFQYASDGKKEVADAITGMGVPTSKDDTFATMAENIAAIETGIDTSGATATEDYILSGKTAGVGGSIITGTMADWRNSMFGVTDPSSQYEDDDGNPMTLSHWQSGINRIAMSKSGTASLWDISPNRNGYLDESSHMMIAIPNLCPQNVRSGARIGNTTGVHMVGTYTSDATATSSQILNGKTAYVNGKKVTGTIINRIKWTWCLDVIDSGEAIDVVPQVGYYDGARDSCTCIQYSKLSEVLGIKPEMIVSGYTICGVAGTAITK